MRRAKSSTDRERLEDDPLGDPNGRLLRLGVGFGAELPCKGETPSREVLVFPRDELSRALCATCLGVAASFLEESMTRGIEGIKGPGRGGYVRIVVPCSKDGLRTVRG